MKTLLSFVSFLVKHDWIIKSDSIRITLSTSYQWCFDYPWNSPCSNKYSRRVQCIGWKHLKITIWIFLLISRRWSKEMEFYFTCFFCISNRDRKCWKYFSSLALNIALKYMLVEFRLPYHEIIFYQVNINTEPILGYLWMYLKWAHFFGIWYI